MNRELWGLRIVVLMFIMISFGIWVIYVFFLWGKLFEILGFKLEVMYVFGIRFVFCGFDWVFRISFLFLGIYVKRMDDEGIFIFFIFIVF